MLRLLLAVVVTGLIAGCTQQSRYQSVEEISSLGNYRDYTLVETLGNATPPFKHSTTMDMVMNKGLNKRVWYMERGVKVQRDLSEYKQQEVKLAYWTDQGDNPLVLVMVLKDK